MTETNTAAGSAIVACPFCNKLNRVHLDRVGDGPKCAECRRPLLLDRPVKVPGDRFDQIIAGTTVPVAVDFYADWCGPCRAMAPTLDDLAQRWAGRALVAKLDTDRAPGISERLGIRGIPTLIVFRDGKEAARHVGVATLAQLEALLQGA